MAKTKLELCEDVLAAKRQVKTAEAALSAWEADPENNVFESVEQARYVIEDTLLDMANDACEGRGRCGQPTYTREFIVDGTVYVGTLTVEYNRHDKTYYYVEESEFTFAPKAEA